MFVKLCRQHPERAKARQWDIVDDLVRRIESAPAAASEGTEPASADIGRDWLFIELPTEPNVTVAQIAKTVSEFYGIPVQDIKSNKKSAKVMDPRLVTYFLARELTTESFPSIGRELGGLHHTTIMSGCRSIARRIRFDFALAKSVKVLRAKLEGVG